MEQSLREDYEKLWGTMVVKENQRLDIIVARILAEKGQYELVELATGVPWYVIGCIHYMEASLNFKRQILNGQRWNKKTTLVPKGKGPWGTWYEASVEAMRKLNRDMVTELGVTFQWDIPSICYAFEDHNGWGYRRYHKKVKSPYLWSFTNHYVQGKYVADGRWSSEAVSKQLGTMAIIKKLKPEPTWNINLSDLGIGELYVPRDVFTCKCGATCDDPYKDGLCPDCTENKPEPTPEPTKNKWWKFWHWL